MTPEEVLEAAFPWPGRTASTLEARLVAEKHDRWTFHAKALYLNRMALMEKMERVAALFASSE